VRVYDFEARLIAKFDSMITDVVWLNWTHDGQELAALSNDGQIKRWPWAATHPTDTSSAQYSDHVPAAVSYRGNDCGQAAAANGQVAHAGACQCGGSRDAGR
jgi:hypothetical protein